MKIINVAGARPNFIKIASLIHEFKKYKEIEAILVHTGQHYDEAMSKVFFDDLDILRPDINLEIGSKSHAVQTAGIMIKFEQVLLKEKPDFVLVVGDVNSTIACALAAVKLGIKVVHVEAGLRSFDRTMPEEINRVLTDSISDYLFITERSAKDNLLKEGISEDKIHFVGNVMIDTLLRMKEKADKSQIIQKYNLKPKDYAMLTLHRPSNVDDKVTLGGIFEALQVISQRIKIVFPIHPRTKKAIESHGVISKTQYANIKVIAPLGYLDSLKLMSEAKLVITDSGGMQEETTVLGIPCVTIRDNTERPITVEEGTNVMVGTDKEKIIKGIINSLNSTNYKINIPKFWDGMTAQRIAQILLKR